jgi:hypothetical protein
MQTAIDLSDNPVEIADMYSDLARESVLRVGMWRKAPDPERIERWIDRAFELVPAEGETRAKVLIARALWGGTDADAAEAVTIAERVGEPGLRFSALMVRSSVDFRDRDYDQALRWSQQALKIVDTLSDPELVADPDLSAVWPALALGHVKEARQLGARVHDMNMGLTPHHQVHAVAVPMEIEELLGEWEQVRLWRAEAEAAVERNLATPCVRNARSILLCALAEEIAGNHNEAMTLVGHAEELRMHGHGLVIDGPRVRLELLRGNLDAVQRLLGDDDPVAERRTGYHLSRISIRLDALAALRERNKIEREAPNTSNQAPTSNPSPSAPPSASHAKTKRLSSRPKSTSTTSTSAGTPHPDALAHLLVHAHELSLPVVGAPFSSLIEESVLGYNPPGVHMG